MRTDLHAFAHHLRRTAVSTFYRMDLARWPHDKAQLAQKTKATQFGWLSQRSVSLIYSGNGGPQEQSPKAQHRVAKLHFSLGVFSGIRPEPSARESGSLAPTAACSAAVAELNAPANSTPWYAANSRSSCLIFSPPRKCRELRLPRHHRSGRLHRLDDCELHLALKRPLGATAAATQSWAGKRFACTMSY